MNFLTILEDFYSTQRDEDPIILDALIGDMPILYM
jgi:hypothetical protein